MESPRKRPSVDVTDCTATRSPTLLNLIGSLRCLKGARRLSLYKRTSKRFSYILIIGNNRSFDLLSSFLLFRLLLHYVKFIGVTCSSSSSGSTVPLSLPLPSNFWKQIKIRKGFASLAPSTRVGYLPSLSVLFSALAHTRLPHHAWPIKTLYLLWFIYLVTSARAPLLFPLPAIHLLWYLRLRLPLTLPLLRFSFNCIPT